MSTIPHPRPAYRRCRVCGQRASILGPAVMIHADLSVSHILCWQLDSERKQPQPRGPGGRFISVARRADAG